MLTACVDEVNVSQPEPNYTVGEAVNAITLNAGISEGGNGVQTRAASDVYVPFSAQTKLRLRVDGTWTGHEPEIVSKMTSASTATSATDKIDGDAKDKHAVEFTPSEALYWDDYGTADPANASTGRDAGLTIYGVAVEGKSSLPTSAPANLTSESLSWTDLSWNVGTVSESKINQKGGWGDYDLITSNNLRSTAGGDGTYKFNHYIHDLKNPSEPKQSVNLLKFTHAMTKITVNLTAGEGFPGYDTGADNAKFETAPEVTLLGFNYAGKVNVEAKISTPTSEPTNIEAWRDNGNTWLDGGQHTSQLTALVFPGNKFSNTTNILKIEADGNIYYVTAAKINAANSATDDVFEQGKNYIFKVTINKTEIKVTATITNWVDVEAAEEAPVINISADWGTSGTGSTIDGFSFYRSTSLSTGYGASMVNTYYPANAIAKKPSDVANQWPFTDLSNNNIKLYWNSHNTHYQFRGVWPITSTESGDGVSAPRVKSVGTPEVQAIDIKNVAYSQGTYPSDLMIARPEFYKGDGSADDPECTNDEPTHTKTLLYRGGICATEGLVKMNFRYVMSQVEVELKSVTGPAAVNIAADTKVEIVNIAKSGYVKLGDREVVADAQNQSYELEKVSGVGNELKRHSAIVPQNLTFSSAGAETNVRFKITVTNNDAVSYADAAEYNAAKGTSLDDTAFATLTDEAKIKTPATTDIYYADINPIKEKGKETKVAPNGKWESGVHYKYVLTLSKTEIKVTATLTDWVTVNASENVWF